MTATIPGPSKLGTPAAPGDVSRWRSALRLMSVFGASLVVFALLLVANGADPIAGYRAMWNSITRDSNAVGDVLVRTVPYLLGALAVVFPARAGLFNIGGEGQLVLGAIGAMAMAEALGQATPRPITLLFMLTAGAAFGALWALVAGVLRSFAGVNEGISTLLLNYLATLVLGWLVFGPWKDPQATGFPRTRPLEDSETLPMLWGRLHIGILIAVPLAFIVWATLRSTRWGFQLTVLGQNPEAARRAGFRTTLLATSALAVGGALAGLGGAIQLTGVESGLRQGIMAGYGFTAVLAAWMVRQSPLKAIASSVLLAAIAIGGNGLKIREGLSAASVNILMALILLAVLGWGRRPSNVGTAGS
jgi:general nucleoside transport system permease protein